MDQKARAVFNKMIERGQLPESGQFKITPELLEISFNTFREIFPPKNKTLTNGEKKFSLKLASLNMVRLMQERVPDEKKAHVEVKSGILYVISNPSFPGFYKVGMTQDLNKRVAQYNVYDPHKKFTVEHYKIVNDRRAEEKALLEEFQNEEDNGEWVSGDTIKEKFGIILKKKRHKDPDFINMRDPKTIYAIRMFE